MKPMVNTERLLKLADHLETVNRLTFNIVTWGTKQSPAECGFVGCAIGHATTIFAEEGLRLIPSPTFHFIPAYRTRTRKKAVTCFFGITDSQFTYLFSCSTYIATATPQMVATRIREIVNQVSNAAS